MIDYQKRRTASIVAVLACLLARASTLSAVAAEASANPPQFIVTERDVDDRKAVFATVRSKDRIEARVRTPGTVVALKVVEGAHVEAGTVLALIADPKIALKIRALDAQIAGIESRLATAKLDYERAVGVVLIAALVVTGRGGFAAYDHQRSAWDIKLQARLYREQRLAGAEDNLIARRRSCLEQLRVWHDYTEERARSGLRVRYVTIKSYYKEVIEPCESLGVVGFPGSE